MQTKPDAESQNEAMWRQVLVHGHRNRWAVLPSNPRCVVCQAPFGGIGGRFVALLGIRASRKSPNLCNLCDENLPPGGAEVEIAVLFADVRGSAGLGERLGPSEFAALMNRFYRVATDVLIAHNAMIDKIVGDEVMALFLPALFPDYRAVAARAGEGLVRAVGYGGSGVPWLPLGVGVHAGPAYVGKVGTEGLNDFTALGDTVNTAARLQAEAAPGEVILSEAIYTAVADQYPGLEQRVQPLRGKEEPITIRILRPADVL